MHHACGRARRGASRARRRTTSARAPPPLPLPHRGGGVLVPGCGREPARALHPAPRRHHPPHAGHRAHGRRGLLRAAGRAPAPGGLPHHPGARQLRRRQSGGDGRHRRHAAGAHAGPDRRRLPDDLPEPDAGLHRQHQHHPAVRAGQEHRRRRPRRAGGDQRSGRLPARQPEQPAELQQGQPRRPPDHGADAHLRHAEHVPDLRRRLHRAGAGHFPDQRRGRSGRGRRRIPRRAGGDEPLRPEPLRHRAGGRARRHRLHQRLHAQGLLRPGRPTPADLHQRPGHPGRRLPQRHRRLPQRRAGAAEGRGRHRRRA